MFVPLLVLVVYVYVGVICARADRDRIVGWLDRENVPYAVALFVVLLWPAYVAVLLLSSLMVGLLGRPK